MMSKNQNFKDEIFKTPALKKDRVLKSINNYLSQLKLHFDLTDKELAEIIQILNSQHKKCLSSKKWWYIFK
ncbi:MAG: hypothetical protein PHX18_08300 [Candidatus Gastranaerophilales bacterium]|nr:hypothetical protein [Candidatus Gastranaerophilales bacterium]